MTDLRTTYMGLQLRNPVVASAGPLSQTVDGVRAVADAGLGAVVMYSLFEQELRRESERVTMLADEYEDFYQEAQSWFPNVPGGERTAVDHYLALVEAAASAIDVPLIASLNGATVGGWVDSARRLQDAGAAAIELNIYMVPGEIDLAGPVVEQRHLEILQAVKDAVGVPVAVKLSPFFSSIGAMCRQLDDSGADALVLFNRFLQPDIDTERMEVSSGVTLSSPVDARLPRTWIAVLHGKLGASLAATSGVETPDDVIKYILAGADVVMTTSALVRHGSGYAAHLIQGLDAWLDRNGTTLEAVRGLLAVPADAPADAYERAGYVSALQKAKVTYGSLR